MIRKSLAAAAFTLAATNPASAPQQEAHPTWRESAGAANTVEVTRVRLSTGVELAVAQAGPRDGTPVLFLHGYTDSWHSYALVLDRLPAGVRAIVPSQRGHGDSQRPACCYGVPELAADAIALLDALGVARAVVVGHSMGSFVAQRVAAERPDRVAKLVLIGSGATLRTEIAAGYNEVIQALPDPVPAEFVREFQVSMVAQMPPAPFMTRVIEESGRMPARVWRDMMTGLLRPDSDSPLERIEAPVLIVWGEHDAVFPRADQDALVARLRDARLVVYTGTGHSPHWEQPARFVAELTAFIAAAAEPSTPAPAAR